ncbi:MAG TPA: carbohydrate ABC transporter permease, partial [Anaerolineae bacterium]
MIATKRRQKIIKTTAVYFGLAFFLVIMLFPFYWMLITSIKPDVELYSKSANPLLLAKPTLDHYVYLISKTPFLIWLKNSLVVTVVSTAISLVVGTMAAYALARLRFRGAQPMGIAIFVTYLVPTTLLFLPLAYVIRSLGLYDNPIALMITYPTFLIPFCTWLLMGYFKGIPKDLEESATVDGATRLQALW